MLFEKLKLLFNKQKTQNNKIKIYYKEKESSKGFYFKYENSDTFDSISLCGIFLEPLNRLECRQFLGINKNMNEIYIDNNSNIKLFEFEDYNHKYNIVHVCISENRLLLLQDNEDFIRIINEYKIN